MNAKQIRATIQTAFAALERACDEHGGDAPRLLSKAFDAALDGEKRHRRFGAGFGAYRQSAETAAKWFCVKWFLDPGKVTNALEAASLRLDCLYASALRVVLASEWTPQSPLRNAIEPVAALDYCQHIAA